MLPSQENPRRVAAEVLTLVEVNNAYSNLLLPTVLKKSGLSVEGRRFVTELVYGTLRLQGLYDRIIGEVAGRELNKIDPAVLVVLRLGAHQLITLSKPPHATVNEMVSVVQKTVGKSVTGFVNACLRRISERSRDEWLDAIASGLIDSPANLSVRYAHPEWIVDEFAQALGADNRADEITSLLAADNVNPSVTCVALPGVSTMPSDAELTPYSPTAFRLKQGDPSLVPGVAEGTVRVQDEGSQLAALALSHARTISAGEQWLDLCAGPGGKAALLAAEASLHGATLICNEVNEARSQLVRSALIAFPDVQVHSKDGRDWGKHHPGSADRIMLDAPCSGLGSLRRRPESRWRKTQADVKDLATLQRELIKSAVIALRPGGILAYVTCTPVLRETEEITSWMSQRHPEMVPQDTWQVMNSFTREPMPRTSSRTSVQLWPHAHGTDAMFISLFTKKP